MFQVITQPTVEPVTLTEIKAHCRVDLSGDDALLSGLIRAAREVVENETGQATTLRTCVQTFDRFPADDGLMALQAYPIFSVSIPLTYFPNDDSTARSGSHTGFRLLDDRPAIVPGTSGWPDAGAISGAVRVEFVAGYGASGNSVPEPLKLAIKQLVGHWYAVREAVNVGNITSELPMMVKYLLHPLKRKKVAE
jgi:uncharacterized phiE125 gp8 family phage protein